MTRLCIGYNVVSYKLSHREKVRKNESYKSGMSCDLMLQITTKKALIAACSYIINIWVKRD